MTTNNRIILSLIIVSLSALVVRESEHQLALRAHSPPLTVYVTGAVERPGAVTLPAGARRLHALASCGGVLDGVDLDDLEPAERLRDGETILVEKERSPGKHPGSASVFKTKTTKANTVNINVANVNDLTQVPGIGPVLAQRIVAARRETPQGTFRSLEDLTAIRGIKKKTLARLSPYLELEGL